MPTVQAMQLTPELLLSIIKGLLGLLGAIIMLFISVVGILHRSITKRLDILDMDLKPIAVQIALHTEQIKELKEAHIETEKWVNNHDGRIQIIERKLVHIET